MNLANPGKLPVIGQVETGLMQINGISFSVHCNCGNIVALPVTKIKQSHRTVFRADFYRSLNNIPAIELDAERGHDFGFPGGAVSPDTICVSGDVINIVPALISIETFHPFAHPG